MKSLFKRLLSVLFFVFCCANVHAQSPERPKLVVGIMIDQMRNDYLNRYEPKFGEDGFKRIRREGFELKNAHYNYSMTKTGPGHASVFTGTTPAFHGIIANDWYDRGERAKVNCVNDPRQRAIGSDKNAGTVSPWRMLSSTVTDELKLFSQKRAKVIGMSLKDRGASLPAGHMADAAYWYDPNTGRFISSTFYFKDRLPQWVTKFNQLNLPDKYLSQVWTTILPIDQYTESGPDDSPYEVRFKGLSRQVFPMDLRVLRKLNGDLEFIKYTPFGNDLLTEFAKAAIVEEKLGQQSETDFLTISFSSTDDLGHEVGPNSVELEDMYIRLDRNIADLLNTLDERVGKGKYTVFITSDHGIPHVAQELIDQRMNAGYHNADEVTRAMKSYLGKYFGDKEIIEKVSDGMVYFNSNVFQNNPREAGVDFIIASELLSKYLLTFKGVANVYPESVIRQTSYTEGGTKGMVARGYHAKRSGDLIYVLEPGWYSATVIQGTDHRTPYTYDTHVPVLFFGSNIKQGSTVRYHPITDIAPTVSIILGISFPSACTGQPIEELFE